MNLGMLHRLLAVLLLAISVAVPASEVGPRRDARALELLRQMSSYKDSLIAYSVKGETSADIRLAEGLIVSNLSTITVVVSQPGSMHFRSQNGERDRELFVNGGTLSLSDSSSGDYVQLKVPADLDSALGLALDKHDIDLPLMDLVRTDTASHLLAPGDEALYLGNQRIVSGVKCHLIVIRTAELDVQVWIEDSKHPLPRRIILTSKWEGGSPRFVGNMQWNTKPDIKPETFKFTPAENASRIDFVTAEPDQPGDLR